MSQDNTPEAVASNAGLGLVPDATWAAVERYADEVHDFNVAVKIDVGVDTASAKCLKAEADAHSSILAFAAEQVAAERTNNERLSEMLAQEKLLRLQDVAAERERWTTAIAAAKSNYPGSAEAANALNDVAFLALGA